MILYQDTSSIVKRYLNDETGLEETQAAIAAAQVLASSSIAFAEVKGVLVRARRARRITSARAFERVSTEFEQDWLDYYAVAVSQEMIRRAGLLATVHALSGVDALQLASALALNERTDSDVILSTWDRELAAAARAEGLQLTHEVNA